MGIGSGVGGVFTFFSQIQTCGLACAEGRLSAGRCFGSDR